MTGSHTRAKSTGDQPGHQVKPGPCPTLHVGDRTWVRCWWTYDHFHRLSIFLGEDLAILWSTNYRRPQTLMEEHSFQLGKKNMLAGQLNFVLLTMQKTT